MEKQILSEYLKGEIKNKSIKAVLFHTFNFDPIFFENYVMPLFVNENNFDDNIINNKILWRYCMKEEIIPPITVYCDYFAKDNTQAPYLGYDISCIKMPSKKGSITNFHPKQIFILFDDDTLLFLTGSGNLTANGWCENFECFISKEIKKEESFPRTVNTNILQDLIVETNYTAGKRELTEAEDKIYDFLKYTNKELPFPYFTNINESFYEFLEENIFTKDNEISKVEIVSPYFSNDTYLIEYLREEKGIKEIKCLIPFSKNNEVQLEKSTFEKFEKAGLIWCNWLDKKMNTEVRNQHSKIYRFYSATRSYTIIGSVNFTKPAWGEIKKKNNTSNLETAILIREDASIKKLLIKVDDLSNFQFIAKKDLENNNDDNKNRNAPEIEFTIDWRKEILTVNAKQTDIQCEFHKIFDNKEIDNGLKYNISLEKKELKQLAKNSLIQVRTKDTSFIFTYYVIQINEESKPFELRESTKTILQYWQNLEDEYETKKMIREIGERTEETEKRKQDSNNKTKHSLNEMAEHFNALVKLELYLFKKEKKNDIYKNLKYFLLADNIGTIPYYLQDITDKHEKGEIQNSLLWMVLQILINIFYNEAERWIKSNITNGNERRKFVTDIKDKRTNLESVATKVHKQIPEFEMEKSKWVISQLIKNTTYENNN